MVDIVKNPIGGENLGYKWLKNFFSSRIKELNQKFYDLYLEKLTLISSEKFINKFLENNLKK